MENNNRKGSVEKKTFKRDNILIFNLFLSPL